ncbi:MAG: aminoglycoside 3-N-acetyltransferase [Rhodobacteraceae bacterium]|nr:aminoglycoside 3-N-acetyltransferase [Paracoccaceae bacterium]
MFSRAKITDDLGKIGVAKGDVLMLHASLKAIGPVAGRADGLLDALQDAVGRNGTLMMVLGAANNGAVFDALTTPADPDVGTLAEILRTRAGAKVSNHPEGRFAALGPHAKTLLASQPWDDYFGPNSPLDALTKLSGKVLRLGADPDTTTLTHLAEYLTPLAGKRRVTRQVLVQGPHGPEQKSVNSLDDEEGIFDNQGEDYFASILKAFSADGHGQTGTIGHARSRLLNARSFTTFAAGWMTNHL